MTQLIRHHLSNMVETMLWHWACIAASGTGLLVLAVLLYCVVDNEPKHIAKEFLKTKRWDPNPILRWPRQLPHFNPVEHAF